MDSNAQFAKEDFDFTKHILTEKDRFGRPKGLTEIYFVGTGDIQLALNDGNDIAANTGLGVLFWRIWKDNTELQLDARINVASTADTLTAFRTNSTLNNTRVFGNYILVPASTGQGTFINTLWYFDKLQKAKIDGLQVSALASNQVWQLNTTNRNPNTGLDETIYSNSNVSIVAFKAGIFHEFIPEDTRRQRGYSIRMGINYNLRSIQGDIARSNMDQLRKELLGTEKRTYHGGDLLLSLRLKNIRAEASLPGFLFRSGESVNGFTGVQFVTSISFVGGFPLSLK
jgi:hypothetical protein